MKEIVFLIEEDPEGGYTARALHNELSIFNEADTIQELKKNIMNALSCHFDDEENIPKVIRLHQVKDEVISYAPAS